MTDFINEEYQRHAIANSHANAGDASLSQDRRVFHDEWGAKSKEEIQEEIARLLRKTNMKWEQLGYAEGEGMGESWKLAALTGILDAKQG